VHNDRWAELAAAVGRLSRASGLEDVVLALAGQGGLLNLVHNTGTTVLDKLPGWTPLWRALEACAGGTPAQVYAGAGPDVQRLLRRWLPRAELRGATASAARAWWRGTDAPGPPAPNELGVIWLTADRAAAAAYGARLLAVELDPSARLVDLRDLGVPVVREIKDVVSAKRETNVGHPIADAEWPRWADFGVLEANPWIVGMLREDGVDGALVADSEGTSARPHESLALLNSGAVRSSSEPRAAGLDPFRNLRSDLRDALEAASDEAHQGPASHEDLDEQDYSVERFPDVPVEKLLRWTDSSSWCPWAEGELAEILRDGGEDALREELNGFRGPDWSGRAMEWLRDGVPAVVFLKDMGGYEDLCDGRGRVSFMVGMGIDRAAVAVATRKGEEENVGRRVAADWRAGYHGASGLLSASAEARLSLECRCADDFGAGYKDDSALTDEDRESIANYEETREAQLAMAAAAASLGLETFVSDSDDRDSRHSDAYVYFPASRMAEVAAMLAAVGLDGDILDVPADFPEAEAERVRREHGWSVERKYVSPGA
jgi:hypothetical protein